MFFLLPFHLHSPPFSLPGYVEGKDDFLCYMGKDK
jgi:hypothetical protein